MILLVDLVYLASNHSSEQHRTVSIRRISDFSGSRWIVENNDGVPLGTVVPINMIKFEGIYVTRMHHRQDHFRVVVSPDDLSSHNLTSNVSKDPINTYQVNETKPLPASTHRNYTLRSEHLAKIISAFTNPNVSCSANKSLTRMLNIYGTKFNTNLQAFIDGRFERIPQIMKYNLPFGFNKSVSSVGKLLKHLPGTGLPGDLQNKSCLRCVVVGNGWTLRHSKLGKVIDNFDVVIRMNNAPTKGFEKDVGFKTTIRIFYPESTPIKEKYYPGVFLMMAFKKQDLTWLESIAQGHTWTEKNVTFWKKVPVKVRKLPEDFRLLNPAIVRETAFDIVGMIPNANGSVISNIPTTGSIAIMLALRVCDEVAIAGFGYDLQHIHSKLHYYDTMKMKDIKLSWTHNITQETDMLLQLVRQGVILDLTGGIYR